MQATKSISRTRPLSAADLEPVIAIDKAASGVSRRGYFEKRLKAATDNPRDYVFVGAFEEEALSGFAFAKINQGEFGKPGWNASLDAIGVQQKHGLHGVGKQLLNEVEKILRHKGVALLTSQLDWAQWNVLSFLAHEGFGPAPRVILTRNTAALRQILEDAEEKAEIDYSSPVGDSQNALSRDRIPVRTMEESDLAKIISIDAANYGSRRQDYFARKQEENLNQSGVRVSLVAERDGFPIGFIMARVDFGEFGRASAEAVMDTVGVDPGFQNDGVGHALMATLIMNLQSLQVESVRTEIDWNDTNLIGYLGAMGFAPAQRIPLQRQL
ncbi:GNAT family N-acetyltransferase [Sulfitobacter sp. JB4-11]|uniref:GNAT family N-acetyltransferase n=1 Tax=Sulfitobacter rhodophyticola TaxID=3238304 RepID=UPI0035120482